MTALDSWLHRQAERERRIVVLEEGLLGGRLWAYFWYRLRFFFATYLVESLAHAVTVLLLFEALAWENFLLVVVATAGTTLISHFWWGALEAMRSQIRDLHRSGSPHRVPAAVGGWLAFTALPAAAFLAFAVGWTAWHGLGGHLNAAEAYVATLLLRVALDLPTRTYHSGVYATRRVYKPLPAALAPELVGLAVLLALWPLAGVWALVVSSLVMTVGVTAITLHYTHRVYHFLGFAPLGQAARAAVAPALRGTGRELLAGGVSHAVMALDSLVVLALLYGAETDSESLVVLFLAMPTIRAGAEWARLLYFDLKRLELRLFTNLRRRFEQHTTRLAWLLGALFWVLASVIATIFDPDDADSLYLALLGFFLARSVLARAQIAAFAERSYGALLGTGLLCVAGLAAVGPSADSEPERLAAVALVTAASALALGRVTRISRAMGEPGHALLTLEWLGRLGNVRDPVRVGAARVAVTTGPERLDARTREEQARWRLDQLACRAAARLRTVGAAAWIGPDQVVWFEPPSSCPRITAAWLQRASGGTISELSVQECAGGEEALLAAAQMGMLGRASTHLRMTVLPIDVAAARRTYEETVAKGVVYAPDEPVPAALRALPKQELRGILFDAVSFARDLGVRRRQSRFDVTALCSGGALRLIFVTDPRVGRRTRSRWHHRVTTLNLRGAIAGARPPRRRPLLRLGTLAWRDRLSTR